MASATRPEGLLRQRREERAKGGGGHCLVALEENEI